MTEKDLVVLYKTVFENAPWTGEHFEYSPLLKNLGGDIQQILAERQKIDPTARIVTRPQAENLSWRNGCAICNGRTLDGKPFIPN